MNATQKYLMKLLLEIDEICKKYEIEYVLDYGTTLGAVRHEGFIPWDDDVDIMMTEDNYYKWVEACKKELDPSKRVYCDGRLNREYPAVFGRYLDVESARIGGWSMFWEPICGQGIDVFVLLPLPGDPVKKQEAIDLYFAYDEFANDSYRHYRMKTERWMELYRSFKEEEKKIGKLAVLEKLEAKIFHQHYDDCDTYIVNSARKKGPTSIVPKYPYDTIHMANFEGHKLPIAGKYIDLMNVYYEDTYCMLPEIPKSHIQMSHSGYGCKVYVDDYMRFFDKDEILKERGIFKEIAVEEGYRCTVVQKQLFEKMGRLERLKVERKIKEKNADVKSLMVATDKEKLAILDYIFSDYYKYQLEPHTRAWECYFEMDDTILEAALYNLLYYRQDFYSIAKILYLRETAGFKKTPKMEEIWDAIQTIRHMKAETIYGNYEEAQKYADYGLAHYPECMELQIGDVELAVRQASTEEEIAACEKAVEALCLKFPGQDQCIKLLGDIAYLKKDIETVKEHYYWVIQNSRNGMLHLDIKKKLEAIQENVPKKDYFVSEKQTEHVRTELQDRLLVLMDEIDAICKKHNLRYTLHNRTAGRAMKYGKFTDQTYQMEILMPYTDVVKLQKIVEKEYSDTRAMEDWLMNPELKQLMFRYVDKNSFLLDMSAGNYFAAPGICIVIYVVKNSRGSEKIFGCERYLQYLNNAGETLPHPGKEIYQMQLDVKKIGVEATSKKYNEPDVEGFLRNKGDILHGIRHMHLGKKHTIKYVLKQLEKQESRFKGTPEEFWYMKRDGGFIRLPGQMFTKMQDVPFEGRTYKAPADFEAYIFKMFGENWATDCLVPYGGTDRMRVMYETNLPYQEYLDYVAKDKISLQKCVRDIHNYMKWYSDVYEKGMVPVRFVEDQVMRSVNRIDLWHKLQKKRPEIKEAYEAKDIKKLRKLLKEYLSKTNNYFNKGIGFYIDDELFECAKLIWNADGKPDYAAEVYALVPEIYKTERVSDLLEREGIAY